MNDGWLKEKPPIFVLCHFGVGVSYASFVAASHAFAIVSTALNGICMNG